MIVAFCGHSTYVENVKDEEEVLAVLESRVGELPCEFFLGGYGNFDQFGYGCAKRFQKKHPNARLLFVTPYLSESYARNTEWRQGRFDGVIYPPLENVPPRYAISRRNRWIVEQADLLFAYITHEFGGAYAMYRYAKQKDKEIYQLGNRIQKQKEGS